jgi:hypothetical protein
MNVEEMLCSLQLVESCRYDSPCNEVVFHFLPFRDRQRITSLPKMTKVLLFARVRFGLCYPFLDVLGQFVLHECIPIPNKDVASGSVSQSLA